MRMAGVADASVMVVMPSKPSLQGPAPLHPLPTPTSDTHSDDVHATPDNNSGLKRKRRSTNDGSTSDEEGNMSKTSSYECRFCNMRFVKSQALGGHMNRHRQEREKEQYHHAQQLVSSMAQQQMPRTWNTTAAADQLRLSAWNVDGFSATRHGSALDCMTGSMHDDLLSGVLQPQHDAVALGGPVQFSNNPTLPMSSSRASLSSATPSFQEFLHGASSSATECYIRYFGQSQ